ncbi:MAG: DoxX family protein [Anaerolineae bacterium]|nr:DoxX family protein [Anaerolineae bacterium]
MNTAIWIVQILLAFVFGMVGIGKLTQPREKLQEKMKWVEDFSARTLKGIGALELLAAIGLVLPALTGILPTLTPLAAAGLILTMIGAMITHIRRREMGMLIPNIILLLMGTFVVYGRLIVVPL